MLGVSLSGSTCSSGDGYVLLSQQGACPGSQDDELPSASSMSHLSSSEDGSALDPELSRPAASMVLDLGALVARAQQQAKGGRKLSKRQQRASAQPGYVHGPAKGSAGGEDEGFVLV